MRRLLLLFSVFIVLLGCQARGQTVQLNEEALITEMAEQWTLTNRSEARLTGWRLQLMSSLDRQQVEEGRQRFRSLFPDLPAAWVHEKPYYKLRVGAFRTRLEAMAFLSAIADVYPGAYPAKDVHMHPRDFLDKP